MPLRGISDLDRARVRIENWNRRQHFRWPAFPPPDTVHDAAVGADVAADVVVDASHDARAEARDDSIDPCGGLVRVDFDQLRPIVMLLVDQSGSMNDRYPTRSSLSTRWSVVRDALMDPERGAVKQLESSVRFGVTVLHQQGRLSRPHCPMLADVSAATDNYDAIRALYDRDQARQRHAHRREHRHGRRATLGDGRARPEIHLAGDRWLPGYLRHARQPREPWRKPWR